MSNFLLEWDKTGEHFYETGVDHGVLYPQVKAQNGTVSYPKGHAWNGLTGVSESPSGGDPNNIYADNMKYLVLRGTEDFGATVTCYTYPDAWMDCDGSSTFADGGVIIGQQARKPFGLAYRTRIGSDANGDSEGYKLHLIYNATSSPSEKAYSTVNESPEAIEFSYEITTTPVAIAGEEYKDYRPISVITIDSRKFKETEAAARLAALEQILYGTAEVEAASELETGTPAVDAYLPDPATVINMLKAPANDG